MSTEETAAGQAPAPGQAAYEAHASMLVPQPWRWDQLDDKLRAAWEAAATAAVAAAAAAQPASASQVRRHAEQAGPAAPAPEITAAIAEARKVREQLAGLLGMFHHNGSGYTLRLSGVRLTRMYTAAGIPVPERLKKLEGQ